MPTTNRKVVMKQPPIGVPTPADFEIVTDAENALEILSAWIKSGQLKYRESVTDGLDSAVDAFIGMLGGRNFGKTMVRVSG